MLPLKLVRALVLGETINNPLQQSCDHDDNDHLARDANDVLSRHKQRRRRRIKTSADKITRIKSPLLLFLPTKELITDTYRLATIARDMGMDLYPTPSLSHIIFSYPSSSSSSSSPSTSSSSSPYPISWSSSSLSSSYLPNDAVPLPFPSLTTASLTHLRSFVTLSKGLFKLAFINATHSPSKAAADTTSNWDCCSLSLFSRLTGNRIDTMDGFSRSLAGMGWTLFKTNQNPSSDSGDGRVSGGNLVYLFRKVGSSRVRLGRVNGDGGSGGECRIRELRLPPLDFGNAPLRILQYILLMTDDIFYLA
ncbi:uncharacterized protein LOC121249970 [Juglans microcarpa x Juglans regia]|uniref:uncharacterized protein LOC121249970 n=1 Tax=Juglans microcarpa x Juglans regia TaxID=2249226 RepID=UPI001B7F422F|nr:uncharacterized protein LOC121249970 [Juglans microcarpa x Juglans regia]